MMKISEPALKHISHTRDVIGPVFQPECRLVAVTLPQGGINDKKNLF